MDRSHRQENRLCPLFGPLFGPLFDSGARSAGAAKAYNELTMTTPSVDPPSIP